MLNSALAGLNDTRTVDVLGTPVDIKVDAGADQLRRHRRDRRARHRAPRPRRRGVARLRVRRQPGARDDRPRTASSSRSPTTRRTSCSAASGPPRASTRRSISPPAATATIGQLYDRVELSAKVPPFVDASGGSLKLTIGDLVATFKNGAAVATQIAINAEVDIKVVTDADGKPRLDVGDADDVRRRARRQRRRAPTRCRTRSSRRSRRSRSAA